MNSILVQFASQSIDVPVTIERTETKTSLFKGVKAWLGLWLVALLCVPVPVIHLVVTPLALLFGPLMGFLVYFKSRRMIAAIDGTCTCPNCGQNFTIYERNAAPPIHSMCPSCKAGYTLRVATAS